MHFKWKGTEKNQELFKNIMLVFPNPMISSTTKKGLYKRPPAKKKSLVKQRKNEKL